MGVAEHFVHFNVPRLGNLLTLCEGGSLTERSENVKSPRHSVAM